MTVVLDTNVPVSAIVFGGKPRLILEMVLRGEIEMVLSEPILPEVQGVLSGRKFRYPVQAALEIMSQLSFLARMVYPSKEINVIKNDPADNRILECALAGEAVYIISGDEDPLTLQSHGKVKIVSPDDFLRLAEAL